MKIVKVQREYSPTPLGQVALGLTGVKANPDLIKIMRYTRSKGIFPNFTLTGADLDYDMAVDLADLCGALAVSCSPTNIDLCFDTVKLFTDLGVQQTNIHVVVSQETVPLVWQLLSARMVDHRLKNMGAIVGLMVKPKGRAKGRYTPPTADQYRDIVREALHAKIPIGLDSCSANRFVRSLDEIPMEPEHKKALIQCSDPCESMCFSIYVDVEARVWPCSFCENEEQYKPIDLLAADDFVKDVWHSPLANNFRKKLLSQNRDCPAFPEIH